MIDVRRPVGLATYRDLSRAMQRTPHADHLVRPCGVSDRDAGACGSSSTPSARRTPGATSRSPSRPTSSSSVMKTTATTATWARSSRRSKSSVRSSCRPPGQVIRGIRFQSVHVFETPERLPEDEVTIVHFRFEDLHLVFLGDLGHPLSTSRTGAATRRRHRPGGRRRPADDRLSRDPRPARRHRTADRLAACTTRRPRSTSTSSRWNDFWKRYPADSVERPGQARSRSRERRCPTERHDRRPRARSIARCSTETSMSESQLAQRRNHIEPHGPQRGEHAAEEAHGQRHDQRRRPRPAARSGTQR